MLKLLVAIWLIIGAAAQTASNSRISANFQGQSGSLTVSRYWDTKKDTTITLWFDKIEEHDSRQNPVVSINLATQTFTWTGPTSITYQGNPATEVTLTSTLSNNAWFQVNAILFVNDTWITHGNITYDYLQDYVKMTYKVKSWPFASTQNTLNLGTLVKFKGGSKGNPDKIDDDGDGKQKKIVFGGGQLLVANTAIIDGVNQPVTPTLYTKDGGGTIKWAGMNIAFPSFTNELDYDPMFGMSAASLATPNMLVMVFLLLLAVVRAF